MNRNLGEAHGVSFSGPLEPFMARWNRSAGGGSVQGRGRRRRPYPDTAKPAADGFGPNRPGPKGLPLAGACFVRPLARSAATRGAAFLADHLAIGQTELLPSNHERL